MVPACLAPNYDFEDILIHLGPVCCSELPTAEQDDKDNQDEDAIVELEYRRLVASGGEAEPL